MPRRISLEIVKNDPQITPELVTLDSDHEIYRAVNDNSDFEITGDYPYFNVILINHTLSGHCRVLVQEQDTDDAPRKEKPYKWVYTDDKIYVTKAVVENGE